MKSRANNESRDKSLICLLCEKGKAVSYFSNTDITFRTTFFLSEFQILIYFLLFFQFCLENKYCKIDFF